MKHSLPILMALGCSLVPGALQAQLSARVANAITPAVPTVAQPFDLRDVKLLDGPFKQAMELNQQYLLFLEPDRLLSGVRQNAGLTPKARRYGGWESQGVAGQTLGHYMTALAQQFRATGDPRFRERVDYIVDELAECQAKDPTGYVAAIPNGKSVFEGLKARGGRMEGWVPWYTMHKLFQGLRDAHRFCGNEKARQVLFKLTDWADAVSRDLTEAEKETMLGMEHGGMPETLADVYALSGDPKHLAVAQRFCHRFVMDPLARGEDRLSGLHANTQVPKIVGAARLYELTGEDYFRKVSQNFWEIVLTNHTFCIGGNSESEHFFPTGQFRSRLTSATAETCNTYNMLRLTEPLFARAPSARLMDYYERALFNQILGSQDPRTGMFTYFQALKPGHFKLYSNPTNAFWCCVGTGMENHTKYGEAIYSRSADTLWVNLFMASELNWREKGVVVKQETQFPDSDTTKLTLSCKQPTRFTLKVRWPAWAPSFIVSLNGSPLKVAGQPGESYVPIEREWRDGDCVDLRLPMKLHTEPLPHTPDTLAVLYGPIVLAAELGTEGFDEFNLYQTDHNQNLYRNASTPTAPVFVSEGNVLQKIERAPGAALVFQTKGLVKPRDVSLIAFYRMHHQRYSVYFHSFTPVGWERHEADLRATEERRKAFEARIVDDVKPGEQQSEVDHAFKGERSSSGGSAPKWRDARDGGWFEYTLKVIPDQPMELQVTYWGSDEGNREFDLLADGQRFATEKLTASKPNELFDKVYSIPAELTRGKSSVVLRFQGKPGNTAGGVFGLRMLKPAVPAGTSSSSIPASFENPVYTGYLADPYCWYHEGMYYAVGTGKRRNKAEPNLDVPMIKSKDLQHWVEVGRVLELPPEERGGAVWAPETAFHNGTFYLYYHANGNKKGFRIRVATSQTPEGPYRDTGTPLTDVTRNDFAIDSTAFRDHDGQWYLFYATDFTNHDATTFRGTALMMDRLLDMTRLEGKPTPVMRAHWPWQIYERNRNLRGEVADWYTLEAPEVVKRGGKYYCFYSGGNYQNDSYGVDYLVADNIRGPWTEVGKQRGPQIVRSIPGKVFGPGHNSIVSSPDGKRDFLVYHAWNAARTDRQVWVDPIVWTPDGPRIERFRERIAEMNQAADRTQ